MAFTHGSRARLYAEGADLSAYLNSVSLPQSVDAAETTVLTDSDGGKKYVPGLPDATISGEGFIDAGTGGMGDFADTAANVGKAGTVWLYFPTGGRLGEAGYGAAATEVSSEITSEIGGAASWSLEVQCDGVDRVISLTDGRETGNGPGTPVDNGTATTDGGVGYLQLFSVTGSITVTIQHSADNVTYADLLSFGAATGAKAARVAVTGTVNRYLRWNRSGTDTARNLAVAFARK